MSTQNKHSRERNQKILLELASLTGNNICADCKARLPRWASYNLGIFICMNCASIHRKIGTHITKVKSLTMDDWTREQVETMKSMGNVKSNAIYNPNEIRNPPPPNLEDSERDSEIELYIRAKYEYKKYFDRSALVASKLGPSRSAPLAHPRSAPLPQPAALHPSSTHVTNPHVAASAAPVSSHTAPPRLPPVSLTVQPPQPSGGVWDDINSLQSNGQNSSLPLQYQQPPYFQGDHSMQPPAANGALGANNYLVGVTASGMGLNPYQVRTNPFSQVQSQSPFTSSSMSSPFSTTTPTSPFFSPAPLVHHTAAPLYIQPQPQTSLQMQIPSGQGSMSSPSQPFPSVPIGQSQFLPPSHGPIQQQYVSHSPQQMQPSSSPQFMYPGPAPVQPQIGSHSNISGQSQFLGMTTMQMQQQQAPQQQQQHRQQLGQNFYSSTQPQMMSGQVNGIYGQTSTYPQVGFPSQTGGQWGTM